MKSIGKILFFAFFLLCLFMLKPRQDVVFEAIDTSQYIKLFEEDRDFVLCLDEKNTFTGSYILWMDTVFLSYREQAESLMAPTSFRRAAIHKNLPQKLYINESASMIQSTDGRMFSAEISLDMRQKSNESRAYSPSELKKHGAQILAFTGSPD